MSIYGIGDLHLSFGVEKPMDIFGWGNHTEKIKKDWNNKVKQDDTVILLGDFSWAMKLQDTLKDFEYINKLPGQKILLKGNHEYWWSTVHHIKNFLQENNIKNVEFLHNNAFEIENKIFCGTRDWNVNISEEPDEEFNQKMIARECGRLELSIKYGLEKFGHNKEIISCLHYPPITKSNIQKEEQTPFIEILKKYNIKKCYYGHLHGNAINGAVQGNINGIELHLISADSVNFQLQKI